jgi:predicted dehydrogenase
MKTMNIAMVGTGFMGKAHAIAYSVMPLLLAAPLRTSRKVVVDVNEDLARSAASRLDFAEHSTNWRKTIERDDIDIVDICTPNDSHAEIAIAAAKAGKHILCEKPLARNSAEAQTMVDAVRASGVTNMVAYNYRHTPAVVMAKRLIDQGRVGEILTFRGHYMQDWSADPNTPLSWRFNKSKAGAGALGDIGTHIIDMARFLLGEFAEVNAVVKTFIGERPEQTGAFDKLGAADKTGKGPKGRVDVDDAIMTLIRFTSGVLGSIESSRNAYGRHNWLGFEMQGAKGTIIFDYQRLNELQVMFANDPADAVGFRTIYSGPNQPYGESLWPVAGLGQGYIEVKSIEWFEFLSAVAKGKPASPSFADGLQVARIADAILASGEKRQWMSVEQPSRA